MRIKFCVPILFLCTYLASCGSKKETATGDKPEMELSYETRIKIRQYVSEGRKLYNQNCSNCHQVNGEGLASLYPPVKGSDYLMNDLDAAICYIKNGLNGEIIVNGVVFNQQMPGNTLLTDLELAEILTYVVNEFNEKEMLISQKEVRQMLKNCQPQ